ncbi:unnamed protein product, partial [Meganyctiphanes norvegica]
MVGATGEGEMKFFSGIFATLTVSSWLVTLLICTPTSNAHGTMVNTYTQPDKGYTDSDHASVGDLSGHMAVQFDGDELEAKAVAEKFGLELVCKVFDNPVPVYHLHKREGRERRAFNPYLEMEIRQQPKVHWAEQQKYHHREKRNTLLMKPTQKFLRSKIINVLNDHDERKNRVLRQKIAESYSRERKNFIEWLENNGYSNSKRMQGKIREKKMETFGEGKNLKGTTVTESYQTIEKSLSENISTTKNNEFGDWLENLIENDMGFNDPFYKDQWYL